jgi:hypothetical protein
MANPFESFLQGIGLMDEPEPIPGRMSEISPAPEGQLPSATYAQPSRGGFFGNIAQSMWGDPLALRMQREQQGFLDSTKRRDVGEAQATNAAEQAILQEAARVRQENPDEQPHKLFNQIIQSPVFAQNAPRVAPEKMTKIVQDLLKSTQKPPPTLMSMAPGAGVGAFDPETGKMDPNAGGSNPTADVQYMNWYKNLSEKDRLIVDAQNAQKTRAPGMTEAAIREMVTRKMISHETGLKLMAGTYKIAQSMEKDELGNAYPVTKILDMAQINPATGQPGLPVGTIGAPDAASAAPPPTARPGPRPNEPVDPAEPPGTRRNQLSDPAEHVLGSGIIGRSAAIVGGVAGNIDPALAQEQIVKQQNATLQIRNAMSKLIYSEGGRTLKKEYEHLQEMMPDTGMTTNPIEQAIKMIDLRLSLEDERRAMNSIILDARGTSPADRQKASRTKHLIDGVLRSMATVEQYEKMADDIRAGRAGWSAQQLLKSVPNQGQVERSISGQPQPQPQGVPQTRMPGPVAVPETADFSKYDDDMISAITPEQIGNMSVALRKKLREEITRRNAAKRFAPPEPK